MESIWKEGLAEARSRKDVKIVMQKVVELMRNMTTWERTMVMSLGRGEKKAYSGSPVLDMEKRDPLLFYIFALLGFQGVA